MRIFVAVRHAQDPSTFHSKLWSQNFYPALRELGHEIVESDVDLEPASRFMQIGSDFTPEEREMRARLTGKIVDEVQAAHQDKPVDLFLSYFYNAHFEPTGFDRIHDLGIPTINFYCNSIYQFDLVDQVAPAATWAWHAERPAREKYERIGANPVWVQMGANPDVYYPIDEIDRRRSACFVGRRYADRDRMVAAIVREDLPIDVYGSGWEMSSNEKSSSRGDGRETSHLGRPVHSKGSLEAYRKVIRNHIDEYGLLKGLHRTYRQWQYRRQTRKLDLLIQPVVQGYADDITETFNAYEVVLNFSNVWSDGRAGSELIPHVRMRDFEGPMCGACYLTGHTEEITEFYEVGTEIDTYRSTAELTDKIAYYLDHQAEAERMRRAGYQRAVEDHTWEERFKELFRKTGLDESDTS